MSDNLDRLDKLISKIENLVEQIEELINMQREIDTKIFNLENDLRRK